jgi:hypothetical protein
MTKDEVIRIIRGLQDVELKLRMEHFFELSERTRDLYLRILDTYISDSQPEDTENYDKNNLQSLR